MFSNLPDDSPLWSEYDSAAEWCARHGLKGVTGDPLPPLLSAAVSDAIDYDPEAFERRVREFAYAIAMESVRMHDA